MSYVKLQKLGWNSLRYTLPLRTHELFLHGGTIWRSLVVLMMMIMIVLARLAPRTKTSSTDASWQRKSSRILSAWPVNEKLEPSSLKGTYHVDVHAYDECAWVDVIIFSHRDIKTELLCTESIGRCENATRWWFRLEITYILTDQNSQYEYCDMFAWRKTAEPEKQPLLG
jgi:hypothetical protein